MTLDFSKSVSGRRCLVYIDSRSKLERFEYDLSETHRNRDTLCRLWDACLGFDADDARYTKDILQAICDTLVEESKVGVLQGVRHKEPDNIEEYQRLFNTTANALNMVDTAYSPPRSIELQIEWTLSSDDDSVTKLTPNVQLQLPFEGVKENEKAML